jgi:hypothetical protein
MELPQLNSPPYQHIPTNDFLNMILLYCGLPFAKKKKKKVKWLGNDAYFGMYV